MSTPVKDYLPEVWHVSFLVMSDLLRHDDRAGIPNDAWFKRTLNAAMMVKTYRVNIDPDDGRVNINTWGLAKDKTHCYHNVDGLPQWMQRKIAVLMIFDPTKPTSDVKGVGRRISRHTFWVYPDEGEDDGDDT
jgi:hypothetical protein